MLRNHMRHHAVRRLEDLATMHACAMREASLSPGGDGAGGDMQPRRRWRRWRHAHAQVGLLWGTCASVLQSHRCRCAPRCGGSSGSAPIVEPITATQRRRRKVLPRPGTSVRRARHPDTDYLQHRVGVGPACKGPHGAHSYVTGRSHAAMGKRAMGLPVYLPFVARRGHGGVGHTTTPESRPCVGVSSPTSFDRRRGRGPAWGGAS